MNKVHYLNSHLHKFRKKNKITIDVENIGDLAHYSNLYEEDKKTTKIFTECFKNKESYNCTNSYGFIAGDTWNFYAIIDSANRARSLPSSSCNAALYYFTVLMSWVISRKID